MPSLTGGIQKEMAQMNLFMNANQKQPHRLKKMNLWLPGGRMGRRDSQGVWDQHVHSAVFKMDNQQGPTV